MPNKLLDAALFYAGMGWSVFPCKPNAKVPITPNGLHDATTDAAIIREWWAKFPAANVAINCGASGLAVVDLDMKDGIDGVANWESWCASWKIVPKTTRAFTPSGGQHLLFKGTVKNSASRLSPGVDTRGEGGYIVASPSMIDGKSYRWDSKSQREPAPLPPEVQARLAVKDRKPAAASAVAAYSAGGTLLDLVQGDGFTLTPRSNQHEGPCPWCGGEDRFVVAWPGEGRDGAGRYHCRQCSADGDAVEWLIRWRGMKVGDAKKSRGIAAALPVVKREAVANPTQEKRSLSGVWDRLKTKPVEKKVRCADCRHVHYRSDPPATTGDQWKEWLECDHGQAVTLAMLETKVVTCNQFTQREDAS